MEGVGRALRIRTSDSRRTESLERRKRSLVGAAARGAGGRSCLRSHAGQPLSSHGAVSKMAQRQEAGRLHLRSTRRRSAAGAGRDFRELNLECAAEFDFRDLKLCGGALALLLLSNPIESPSAAILFDLAPRSDRAAHSKSPTLLRRPILAPFTCRVVVGIGSLLAGTQLFRHVAQVHPDPRPRR